MPFNLFIEIKCLPRLFLVKIQITQPVTFEKIKHTLILSFLKRGLQRDFENVTDC